MYICKLRLLQYGLVDEVAIVDAMGAVKGSKSKATSKEADSDDSDDPDEDDYMQKRTDYVTRRIREAKKEGKLDGLMPGGQNPIAAEARRDLIKAFFKDINSFKKCVSCSGYVMQYSSTLTLAFPANIMAEYPPPTKRIATTKSSESNYPRSRGLQCCKEDSKHRIPWSFSNKKGTPSPRTALLRSTEPRRKFAVVWRSCRRYRDRPARNSCLRPKSMELFIFFSKRKARSYSLSTTLDLCPRE